MCDRDESQIRKFYIVQMREAVVPCCFRGVSDTAKAVFVRDGNSHLGKLVILSCRFQEPLQRFLVVVSGSKCIVIAST